MKLISSLNLHPLVCKLLRQRMSAGQLIGFSLANLVGLSIVLLSLQFYLDVIPFFSRGDSFMKETYAVVGKRVLVSQTLAGDTPSFTSAEIADFSKQPFVRRLEKFTPAQFDVFASIGNAQAGLGFTTDMFFEAIPDRYVDADLSKWNYRLGGDTIPVILPKNYLNLYNFGFASTKGLPALSEAMVGMVQIRFYLRGTQQNRQMAGRVVAFSDRINTILVPQAFMNEANAALSPDRHPLALRLIVELTNPADERFVNYLRQCDYEEEGNAGDASRITFFLRLVTGIVMVVGLIICTLSFYILLLSIFLLLQKHTEKIDNLLLIGYSPSQVALPFHALMLILNVSVQVISLVVVYNLRRYYTPLLEKMLPGYSSGAVWPVFIAALCIFLLMEVLHYFSVRQKIRGIWHLHEG